MTQSFIPQVQISGQWSINSLRFARAVDAARYAEKLTERCAACDAVRIVPSTDRPTHALSFFGNAVRVAA